EPVWIRGGDQDREPCEHRRDPPRKQQEEQDDEVGDREDDAERDRQPIAHGRIDHVVRRRIRRVAERRVRIFEQHQIRERAHAPSHVERRELPDGGDVRSADDQREPAHDRQQKRHESEDPAVAPERLARVDAEPHRDAESADEDDVRDREDDPERRREPIAARQLAIDGDGDGIRHRADYAIMPRMRRTLVAAILTAAWTFPQAAPAERGTIRLHYVEKPIGVEHYDIARDASGLHLTSDFEFTDRGGRVQLAASLHTAPDLTPIRFTATGKSYRFVNVDSEVRVDGGAAIVRAD